MRPSAAAMTVRPSTVAPRDGGNDAGVERARRPFGRTAVEEVASAPGIDRLAAPELPPLAVLEEASLAAPEGLRRSRPAGGSVREVDDERTGGGLDQDLDVAHGGGVAVLFHENRRRTERDRPRRVPGGDVEPLHGRVEALEGGIPGHPLVAARPPHAATDGPELGLAAVHLSLELDLCVAQEARPFRPPGRRAVADPNGRRLDLAPVPDVGDRPAAYPTDPTCRPAGLYSSKYQPWSAL